MSHMHLIDHLDATKTIGEFAKQPFLVYLISLAKAEAMTTTVESSAPTVAASGASRCCAWSRILKHHPSRGCRA